VAPEAAWEKLRRDLLEFEEHIACEQHAVGCVTGFPFKLELKKDATMH
jgi:hypothetical protein